MQNCPCESLSELSTCAETAGEDEDFVPLKSRDRGYGSQEEKCQLWTTKQETQKKTRLTPNERGKERNRGVEKKTEQGAVYMPLHGRGRETGCSCTTSVPKKFGVCDSCAWSYPHRIQNTQPHGHVNIYNCRKPNPLPNRHSNIYNWLVENANDLQLKMMSRHKNAGARYEQTHRWHAQAGSSTQTTNSADTLR